MLLLCTMFVLSDVKNIVTLTYWLEVTHPENLCTICTLIKDKRHIKHLSYDKRLENLGLSCLTTRRVRSDFIQTFKIIKGIDKVDKS